MRYFLFCCSILLSSFTYSQKTVKGLVLDAEKGQPIPGASVFLSNTSIGTTANLEGVFTLTIPAGKYDLIVSSIGFETHNQTIHSATLPEAITIKLNPKAKELETIILEPFEKDGWDKWGVFFLNNFIGTSEFSKNCIIKNKDVIKFRHSKKTNEITAIATEPLLIENKSLGYTVRYQLEDFSYNFKTRLLFYAGYPFFTTMVGNETQQRRWVRARNTVYHGSMMHFMRSVFRNTLASENFDVFALKKVLNNEKARVKEITKSLHTKEKTVNVNKDSSAYYHKVLAQEDYFDIVGKTKLTGDSIAYAVNSTTAGIDFTNYLLVIYTKGRALPEYSKQFPKNSSAIMSQLTLINQRPIEIQSNGSYYQPSDIMSLGYWAWFEKIATMLPFDYKTKD